VTGGHGTYGEGYALKTDRTEWTGWVLACHLLVSIEKMFLAAAA